jgi:hypothetical protein
MDLKQEGYECVDWIHLIQKKDHRQDLVNTVMKSSGPIKGEEFLD